MATELAEVWQLSSSKFIPSDIDLLSSLFPKMFGIPIYLLTFAVVEKAAP